MRLTARPVTVARPIARSTLPATARHRSPVSPSSQAYSFTPDPHVDYGRFLTEAGGVLIIYKDIDQRLRHTLWRIVAWTISTGFEGWLVFHQNLIHSLWLTIACLLAMAVINWLIVAKPVEIYRRIEVRPDCLILDGADIFWRRYMDTGWPAFRPDNAGNQVLCGIYGTRLVDYLTARRFDEFDRMPEVFAAHFQEVMQQLWNRL